VYWPPAVMLPGPLFSSPPETDQVTAAAPPPVSVAVNCSTDAPRALVALQPVQLVSILVSAEPAPGEMEKTAFEESADTPPPAQPATASRAGAKKIETFRRPRLRMVRFPIYCIVHENRCRHDAGRSKLMIGHPGYRQVKRGKSKGFRLPGSLASTEALRPARARSSNLHNRSGIIIEKRSF